MVSTDLGACEWFVWDIRRSNLLDRGELDQVVGEFLEKHPAAEPPELAAYLVDQGVLTRFQADRLLQGKTQGFVLGPFTLMDALGTGSMGTVYKAQSKNDQRWYAVKVLPRRSMWNVRIARRKVRAFEECRHPTVVPFVDVGTAGGMHYLAWPLVDGETLEKRVQREGKLSPDVAAGFALQAAEGLAACHTHGLFHGLLKPSNLMISPDRRVHILDFGIGSLLAETDGESLVDTMSTANSVASGLDCASPESIMEPTNLTPLGDQYSLGCVLYFCLTGRYPFPDGTTAEKMMAHQSKQPVAVRQLVPELSAKLAAVVERLMEKSPEARYGTTAEVVEALRSFASVVAPRPSTAAHWDSHLRSTVNGRSGARAASPVAAGAAREESVAPGRTSGLSGSRTLKPDPPPERPFLRNNTAPSRSEGFALEPPTRRQDNNATDGEPGVTGIEPTKSWEERLGPTGIAIGAVLLCVLAWLLTWKLF